MTQISNILPNRQNTMIKALPLSVFLGLACIGSSSASFFNEPRVNPSSQSPDKTTSTQLIRGTGAEENLKPMDEPAQLALPDTMELTLNYPLASSEGGLPVTTPQGDFFKRENPWPTMTKPIAIDQNTTALKITVDEDANPRDYYLSDVLLKLHLLKSFAYKTTQLHREERDIIGHCTQLTSLTLDFQSYDDPHKQPPPFLVGLTQLTDLTFRNVIGHNCGILESVSKLPELTSLNIGRLRHDSFCKDFACLDPFVNLTRLSLTITDPAKELNGCRPPLVSLLQLELRFNGDVIDELIYFATGSAFLEELNLLSFSKTSGVALDAYRRLTDIKSLKTLRLPKIKVTEEVLALAKLRNLQLLAAIYDKDCVTSESAIRAEFKENLPNCRISFDGDDPK